MHVKFRGGIGQMKKKENGAYGLKRSDERIQIKSACIYLLAFLVPFTIMCVAFAASQIYPFGSKQVLAIDAWHQYYPFLTELRRKIREGESLLYCWHMGMGSGFMPIIAYYLASPLNLLFVVFPQELLREVYAFITLFKIGMAGAICAFSLNKISQKNEYGIVIFSTFYALCNWVLGYYWNIMWLDTFALFPLVALGISMLVKEGKYKLYTISLAASIITNYYMGMMVCIFTAVYFFVQCILKKIHIRELWNDFKHICLYSFIAIMISAIVTLPTVIALQNTVQQRNHPSSWKVVRGWIETLANTFAYTDPTAKTGLPNLYCGLISIVFLFAFYKISKITIKEKIGYSIIVLLLFVSTNINMLDFAWHGFRMPNQIPYRYTFMLAFLLVMLAYKVYSEIDALKLSDWLSIGIASGIYFLLIAAHKISENMSDHRDMSEDGLWALLLKNLLLITIYLAVLFLFVNKKMNKRIFTLCLAVTAGLELVPAAITAPEVVGVSNRNNYPDKYEQMQEILSGIEDLESENEFYRVELAKRYSRNPSIIYGYNGFDIFSSTTSARMKDFYEKMGLVADDNGLWYYYQNSTPINNTFLNLKYLISKITPATNQEYLEEFNNSNDIYAYKNTAFLPIAFMVENDMADFQFDGATPFENQNNLLKAAAGIKEDVFEPVDVAYVGHKNIEVTKQGYGVYSYAPSADADKLSDEKFVYNYVMPEDGSAYVYMNLNLHEEKDVDIGSDGRFQSYEIDKANIFPAGTHNKGEMFTVRTEMDAGESGDLNIYASILNQDVFDQAYDLLKDEVLNVSAYSSKSIKGTISAKQDGLMYTSIPYETGWNVYVDGKKAEITLIADALIGVKLTGGEHVVEFKYAPLYVYLAVFVSIAGIGLFVCICILDKKKHLKL